MTRRTFFLLLSALLLADVALAGPFTFNPVGDLPPVLEDGTKVAGCVATFLVTDITTSDTLAVRMRIPSKPDNRAVNNVMPCPKELPPRVALRALDACVARAADPNSCVYADAARDFPQRPISSNSVENTSRCLSDQASDIGIACWQAKDLQICGVGCGASPEAAIASAVSRCEAKHQTKCPITGSLPVAEPR